jgi:nucleoside-diphosphate-sugar epimerase
MRVLMVVPGVLPYRTGGGVAEVNWAVLSALRARGHQVLAVASTGQPDPVAVVDIQEVEDPYGTIVKPAVEGTRNVLASAVASQTVKRFVFTSSCIAG